MPPRRLERQQQQQQQQQHPIATPRSAAQRVFENADLVRCIAAYMCVGSRCRNLKQFGYALGYEYLCGGGWALLCLVKLNPITRAHLARTAFAAAPSKNVVIYAGRRPGCLKSDMIRQLLLLQLREGNL
jgi:hypothetical protein